jgi:hypothetical protein
MITLSMFDAINGGTAATGCGVLARRGVGREPLLWVARFGVIRRLR